MCSIIIVNHHHKSFPLIIAANRDEDYDRPFTAPQLLSQRPKILGGRDNHKDGSWLAVNEHNLFAAITNQGRTLPNKESRGKVVLDLLQCKTLNAAIEFVEELNPIRYNGFNLVFGNQNSVYVAYSHILHSMVIKELPVGISTITSDVSFRGNKPQAVQAHRHLNHINDQPWKTYYPLLKSLLASTTHGVKLKLKRKENGDFGRATTSSSILAFNKEGLSKFKFYDRVKKESTVYQEYANLLIDEKAVPPVPTSNAIPDLSDLDKVKLELLKHLKKQMVGE